MKIAILTGWYPNEVIDEDGLSVRNQAKALFNSGLDVSVISVSLMRQFFAKGKLFPIVKKSIYDGLPQYSLEGFHPSRKGKLLFEHYNTQVIKPFNAYIEDKGLPDLIHVHNYTTAWAAVQLKKEYGIPFILTEHSTSFMDGWVPKSHDPYIKEIFQEAAHVFGVSEALANAMQGWTSRKVKVLPNFIDTSLFCPPKNYIPLEYGPKLLSVSTFSPRKQIDLLIRCIPKLLEDYPRVQFNIVGYGPEDEKLQSLTKELGLRAHIKFLGQVSQEEVATHMQNHHLLVTASHTETFGVVYVEALSCGLPVVALDCGGVQDMVDEGVNGYIVEKEIDLVNRIKQAIKNYKQWNRNQIAENCRTEFGVENNVERHRKIYTQVLSST